MMTLMTIATLPTDESTADDWHYAALDWCSSNLPTPEQLAIREGLYQGRNAYLAGYHEYDQRAALWAALVAKSGWSAELADLGLNALIDAYWAAADDTDRAAAAAVAAWKGQAGL